MQLQIDKIITFIYKKLKITVLFMLVWHNYVCTIMHQTYILSEWTKLKHLPNLSLDEILIITDNKIKIEYYNYL